MLLWYIYSQIQGEEAESLRYSSESPILVLQCEHQSQLKNSNDGQCHHHDNHCIETFAGRFPWTGKKANLNLEERVLSALIESWKYSF